MLAIETHCAACGGEMFQVRRRIGSLDGPDSEPLCNRCVQEMLDESSIREDEEPWTWDGRTCSPGCGWCGRCT